MGCRPEAATITRTVTLHAPGACGPGGVALDGGAYGTYSALGDFDPPSVSPPGTFLGAAGQGLSQIDGACRALVVQATEDDTAWSAVGPVSTTGDVDMLLLPALRSCALPAPVTARAGAKLAPAGMPWELLVGGVAAGDAGSAFPPTSAVRLDTGAVVPVAPDLLTPLVGASVTAFGDGALVAGGANASPGGSVLATAEVYAPALGGFDQQHPILLSAPRAHQGAVVLATGETLLVGGIVGADGQTVLDSMEVVDPNTRTVRAENVARLTVARQDPDVLRLASGEILVAGGVDASGVPVSTIEWFAPDASAATKRPNQLVSGDAHAYVALEAGGALAVVTPPPNAAPNFQNVWVIDADGALEAGTPIAGALTQPVLFGGAGGGPALWTGDRWLRRQPWTGAFAALGALDDTPAHVGDATSSPDPGLAMWLDPDLSAVIGLRFDVRGVYSPLPAPLLVEDATDMAPDALAGSGSAHFDASLGLVLAPGAAAFVTDRTYADVAIDVDWPTGEVALVVLRDQAGNELEVGGVTCPAALAPAPPATSLAASSMRVQRSGSSLTWSRSTGEEGTCPTTWTSATRLSLGLRGPPSRVRAVATNLRVAREGPK